MSVAGRFYIKQANLATILPAVAGPALGGFTGRALGMRYPSIGPEVGALIGGISGGVGGQLLKEQVEGNRVPSGAPYAIDPTSEDIPPWALQGAQFLQPTLKQAGQIGDVVGGDLGGLAWPVAQGIRESQPAGQIARNVAGQGLGTLGGGFLGHGVGHIIDKLVGHPVTGPFGVPLSTLLAGLGATIGNVKGLEIARGTQGA